MPAPAHIEIHRDGQWIPAASLEPLGDDRARVEYLPEYIFSDDPWPIALNRPVSFAPPGQHRDNARAPAFLYDLVPQARDANCCCNYWAWPTAMPWCCHCPTAALTATAFQRSARGHHRVPAS